MATINDLPKVEGIRDFFVSEIYGEVTELLTQKGYFGDRNNEYYKQSLDIISKSRGLVDVVMDDRIPNDEKDVIIEREVQALYNNLANLKSGLMQKTL